MCTFENSKLVTNQLKDKVVARKYRAVENESTRWKDKENRHT